MARFKEEHSLQISVLSVLVMNTLCVLVEHLFTLKKLQKYSSLPSFEAHWVDLTPALISKAKFVVSGVHVFQIHAFLHVATARQFLIPAALNKKGEYISRHVLTLQQRNLGCKLLGCMREDKQYSIHNFTFLLQFPMLGRGACIASSAVR